MIIRSPRLQLGKFEGAIAAKSEMRKPADKGLPVAQSNLGSMYLKGEGVEKVEGVYHVGRVRGQRLLRPVAVVRRPRAHDVV
jgi:TPR repeat protein